MNKIRVFGLIELAAVVGLVVLGIYAGVSGPLAEPARDAKNATYMIEGTPVTLVDGVSVVESVPGSASKVVTKYFGNDAKGDINADGIEDLAFLLTQERGGSGTFFYVVGAVQAEDGTYRGTDGVLLGDRVSPQNTEIREGKVIANYADRRAGEPMTTKPSQGKSLYLKLDPSTMQFGIVVQDFGGEADPARMTLDMKEWIWVSALYSDEREVKPKEEGAFTLSFEKGGRFSARTDCNTISGNFSAETSLLRFSSIAMTKKFCEDSQETEFAQLLETASGFHFTSRGALILNLKSDSGSAVFR